jgi:hypothetical protein
VLILIKALLVVGLHELKFLREAKRSSGSALWHANSSSHQTVPKRADKLIRNDRMMVTRQLVIELSALKGSVNNIIGVTGYSEMYGF